MSEFNKQNVNIESDYQDLINCLEDFVKKNKDCETETVYTASTFLRWIKRKTEIISQEKEFTVSKDIELRRTKVFWVDFGFNIGQEFGGKHPAIILRVSGQQVFVLPLSSQAPDPDKIDNPMFVKIPNVFDFPYMTRWINVLNIKCVSIQRIDFSSHSGRVSGKIMDKISEAISKCGIR